MAYSTIELIYQYEQYNAHISTERRKYLKSLRYKDRRGDYEKTPEWNFRKRQKIKIAGYRCERCPSTNKLQVHHLSYEHYGDEPHNELLVLCKECHAADHGKTKNHSRIASVAKEMADKDTAIMSLMY